MNDVTGKKTGLWSRWGARRRTALHSRVSPPGLDDVAQDHDDGQIAPEILAADTEVSASSGMKADAAASFQTPIIIPEPRAHAARISNALHRVFEQTQQDEKIAAKAGNDPSFKTLTALFPVIDDQPEYAEVILRSNKAALFVEPHKIELRPMAGADGQPDTKAAYTAENIHAMVLVASKNKAMLEKGVRLSGSKEQQEMMRAAIERVNSELPAGQKLVIRPPKAAVQPAHVVAEEVVADATPAPAPAATKPTPVVDIVQLKPVIVVPKTNPVAAPVVASRSVKPVETVDGARRALLTGRNPKSIETPQPAPVHRVTGMPKASNDGAADEEKGGPSLSRRAVTYGFLAMFASPFVGPIDPSSANTGNMMGGDTPTKKSEWSEPASEPLPQMQAKFAAKQDAPLHTRPAVDASPPDTKTAIESPQREFGRSSAQERTAVLEKRADHRVAQQPAADGKLANGQVRILNKSTGERIVMDFAHINPLECSAGDYRKCYGEFNYVARDWRRNEVKNMDPELMKVIATVVTKLRGRGYDADQLTLLSGYRSPETNSNTRRAGRRSQHLHGKALDFRIEGVPSRVLNDVCCEVVGQKGGVGRYSNYAHVDTRGFGVRWFG